MSGRYREKPDVECKVYVGDLPKDASDKELERSFSYYGPLKNVWVARNPPGFAFVEFEDPRDADDAIKGLDGTTICGVRARVEHSSGKVRPKPWQRGGRDGPRDGGRGSWGPSYGDRGGGGARRRRSNSRSRSRSYDRTDRRRKSRSRSR